MKMPSVVDLDAVTVDFFLYGSGQSRILEYCWCEGSVHRSLDAYAGFLIDVICISSTTPTDTPAHFLRILAMAFPLASSSTNLSR